MTPAERRRVVDSLPSKLDISQVHRREDYCQSEVVPLPETGEFIVRLGSLVGDLETRMDEAERRTSKAERRTSEAERRAEEAERTLAEALAEIDRLKRERP